MTKESQDRLERVEAKLDQVLEQLERTETERASRHAKTEDRLAHLGWSLEELSQRLRSSGI